MRGQGGVGCDSLIPAGTMGGGGYFGERGGAPGKEPTHQPALVGTDSDSWGGRQGLGVGVLGPALARWCWFCSE